MAHKVCLLIVQLHIDTKKPTEALKLITYIESQFVSTENATNILTGSADQVGPIHTETDKTEKVYTMTTEYIPNLLSLLYCFV